VQIGTKRRELFEFCNLKKIPLRDLHRVVEHPDRLRKRFLEKMENQQEVFILHLRRREEGQNLPRGLSESSEEIALWCVKTLQRHRSQRILRGFERRRKSQEE
jgi:hypothetical protein